MTALMSVVDPSPGVVKRDVRAAAAAEARDASALIGVPPTLAAVAATLPPRGALFRAASLLEFDICYIGVSAAVHARSRALRASASPCSHRRPWGGPAALIGGAGAASGMAGGVMRGQSL